MEGTAGNIGIGLAHMCLAMGYKCVIYLMYCFVCFTRSAGSRRHCSGRDGRKYWDRSGSHVSGHGLQMCDIYAK